MQVLDKLKKKNFKLWHLLSSYMCYFKIFADKKKFPIKWTKINICVGIGFDKRTIPVRIFFALVEFSPSSLIRTKFYKYKIF